MTAKPVDDINKAASGYWNSNPVSPSNPGGLDESDDGLTAGHVDNFPAAVGAVGRMTQWIAGVADTIDAQAFATGGTVAMIWDAGTADANPGAGKARGNAPSPSAVTALYLSTTDADGADVAALLVSWGVGGSATKGALRLAVLGNRSQRADFHVVGAAVTHSGYVTLPVAYVGSTATIAAGSALALGFVQAGGVGAAGPTTGYWGGLAGGVAAALTATTGAGLSALTVGTIVGVKTPSTSNSGAVTLTVDSCPPVSIRKDGAPLTGGDLLPNTDTWLQFDGVYFRLVGGGSTSASPFSDIASISTNTALGSGHLGKMIETTGSSPITLSVSPTTIGKGSFGVLNQSAAFAAISAATGSAINGAASWRLAPGEGCIVTSDGLKMTALGQGGNYSSFALDPAKKGGAITLSGANLTAAGSPAGNGVVLSVAPLLFGDWAWEVLLTTASGTWAGIATAAANLSTYVGADANSWGYGYNGTRSHGGDAAYGSSISDGGTLMVLCRVTAGAGGTYDFKMWVQVAGVVQGGGDPAAGTAPAWSGAGVAALYPAWSDGASGSTPIGTMRFSKTSWSQMPAVASFVQIP